MIQHVTAYEGMCLSSDGALRGTRSLATSMPAKGDISLVL